MTRVTSHSSGLTWGKSASGSISTVMVPLMILTSRSFSRAIFTTEEVTAWLIRSTTSLFITFLGTRQRLTALHPKPIVLLPGINENAEFSISLGSERVVAGELVAVDVSLANVQALMGYGFALNYDTDKFEFVSVAPADEDLLTSTGGETMLFHNMLADGQIEVVNGMYQWHGSFRRWRHCSVCLPRVVRV